MRVICLAIIILNFQPAFSQPEHQKKILVKAIDSILQSQVNQHLIPGAVILIKKDGKVVYEHSYGFARIYDRDHNLLASPEKMTTGTMFDIASLTKVVGTTTAIMWLSDKKLLSVDDPVSKYIKAFDTPEKKYITLRHLLTHTSGIFDWYPMYYRASNRQETFSLIANLPLADSIGKHRKYSDLGFTILGQVIENVSGMPLEDFVLENIFTPLGMNHTMYNPIKTGKVSTFAATSFGNPYEKRMVYDSSLGYRKKEIVPGSWNGWRNYVLAGEVNDGNAWYANGGVSGAAGLFSTVEDLQLLVDMLLNNGTLNGKPFISKETIARFLTMDGFKNGLGWMMDPGNSFMKNGPEGSFGHTGFTGTSIAVIPKNNISVILLINRQHTGLSAKGDYYNVNPVREQVFTAVMRTIGLNQ
jgi:CubicO group peptidase (beta-lactamase class C family)